jgi:hypothetical protein
MLTTVLMQWCCGVVADAMRVCVVLLDERENVLVKKGVFVNVCVCGVAKPHQQHEQDFPPTRRCYGPATATNKHSTKTFTFTHQK